MATQDMYHVVPDPLIQCRDEQRCIVHVGQESKWLEKGKLGTGRALPVKLGHDCRSRDFLRATRRARPPRPQQYFMHL